MEMNLEECAREITTEVSAGLLANLGGPEHTYVTNVVGNKLDIVLRVDDPDKIDVVGNYVSDFLHNVEYHCSVTFLVRGVGEKYDAMEAAWRLRGC